MIPGAPDPPGTSTTTNTDQSELSIKDGSPENANSSTKEDIEEEAHATSQAKSDESAESSGIDAKANTPGGAAACGEEPQADEGEPEGIVSLEL